MDRNHNVILANNVTSSFLINHAAYSQTHLTHRLSDSVIKIRNSESEFESAIPFTLNYKDTALYLPELPDQQQDVDYLYNCVNELNNNLDCLLKPGGNVIKKIYIGGKAYLIPLKHTVLPSGKVMLAGYLEQKLIVFHHEIYFLENTTHKSFTFLGALGKFLAHTVGSYPPSYASYQHTWFGKFFTWCANVRDPLNFPHAEGNIIPTRSVPEQIIYSAEAVISAHIEMPNNASFPTPRQLPTHGVPKALGVQLDLASGNTTAEKSEAVAYYIGEREFKLDHANAEARELLYSLKQELINKNATEVSNGHYSLLDFDKLLAEKADEIFYKGLYFHNNNYSANILIIKSQVESHLAPLQYVENMNSNNRNEIAQHSLDYNIIIDYIPDIDSQLVDAYRHIDLNLISEMVLLLRNNDLLTLTHELTSSIRNKSLAEREHIISLLKLLKVFKKSHEEYSRNLFNDADAPLNKVTYLNSQKIFNALIYHDKSSLITGLLKLRFYHIFEYTRINDISIHSSNFLLPGEMLENSHPFTADEEIIDEEDVQDLFTDEVQSYIYYQKQDHPRLNMILKLVELYRLNEPSLDSDMQWQEKLISPWERTYTALLNIITNNDVEKNKISRKDKWHLDFKNVIQNDKSTVVMLAYLTHLQRKLITHIQFFLYTNVVLIGDNHEQLIIAAKIEAIKTTPALLIVKNSNYQMLQEFQNRMTAGDFDILTKAAVFWYLTYHNRRDEDFLISLNVLYVVKSFISAQQYIYIDYKRREQEENSSIFKLSPSDKKNSLEDYYQQFYEYKHYYSFHEARKITWHALQFFAINYIETSFPPREIFCFKIFSRNYITNSLSPFKFVLLPHDNMGYLAIIRLHSGKLSLLSTLNGYVLLHNIDALDQDPFIHQLMDLWRGSNANQTPEQRPPFAVNAAALARLFPVIDTAPGGNTTLVDLILFPPEDRPVDSHAPPFTLVPVTGGDILTRVSPYLNGPYNYKPPLSITTPLIENIDYLVQATLLSMSDRLKETLHNYSWPQYIASFIPFFDVLCRYLYDKEHNIKFSEIMFDLFDLITTLIVGTGEIKKIADTTLKQAINKAIQNNIPRNMLKKFIIQELISATPDVGRQSLFAMMKEFTSFLCPLKPVANFAIKLSEQVKNRGREIIILTNDAIRATSHRKRNLRRQWQAHVDKSRLEMSDDGLFIDNRATNKQFYVVNNNDFYNVFWDKYNGEWRIVNNQMEHNRDLAIAVVRSNTGDWIAKIGSRKSQFISSYDFYQFYENSVSAIELIKCEPARMLSEPPSVSDGTVDFHKKVLRFYLYRNRYVKDILNGKARNDEFLDRFHRSFFFRQEVIDSLALNGYSHEENFLVSAIRALQQKHDGLMHFRAVCAWRNQHMTTPETYFSLRIDIGKNIFIVDLEELRSSFNLLSTQDVYTEDEWLMMYNRSPLEFELIKYKDYDFIEDAHYLTYREATAPDRILRNGFLLKEPAWYRPMLSKDIYGVNNEQFNLDADHPPKLQYAARSLRYSSQLAEFNEEFPARVLHKCKRMSNGAAEALAGLLKAAKRENLNSHAILVNKQRIISINELLRVNEGIVLAFYNTNNFLEHSLLSLGQGRFIGVKNNFLLPELPSRVSIVIAEQFGAFNGGLLKLHHNDQQLFVLAGNAFGVEVEIPHLAEDLPREKLPIYQQGGRQLGYKEQIVPREEQLIGKDCHVDMINESNSRLRIKLHGAPFNVNHMDAIEFTDIIRALPYLENNNYTLGDLGNIELFSCYSGYGGRFSTAQILADELGLPIKAYPYKISDDIRSRRPEWFTVYNPRQQQAGSADNSQSSFLHHHESFSRNQAIHRRLHELVEFVWDAYNQITLARKKRDIFPSPANASSTIHIYSDGEQEIFLTAEIRPQAPIFVDIIQQLCGDNNPYADSPRAIQLSAESLVLFDAITEEYNIAVLKERPLVEQAFLDVVLSVEEYAYLSQWFDDPTG